MKLPAVISIVLSLCVTTGSLTARKAPQAELTAKGEELRAAYARELESLRAEIRKALPEMDPAKIAAYEAGQAQLQAINEARKEGESAPDYPEVPEASMQWLKQLDPFLASDAMDDKLVKCALLTHATPHGLAAFAQQGQAEKALLDDLFKDPVLMKRMMIAGGAADGNYGGAFRLYQEIRKASKHAREEGVLERLALGTALQQANTAKSDDYDPIPYYLYYVESHLNNDLDPGFKDMTVWECRYITERRGSIEEMKWCREMLRCYRPDHILMEDYRWRYVRIVKSDFPYASSRPSPRLAEYPRMQQLLDCGGICGPRAFFGRLSLATFGIPNRPAPQTGHGALSHWTPDGWTVNLGGHWRLHKNNGLGFLLESSCRMHPESFLKVLRAQWIADALEEGETPISGLGGGFWNTLAYYKQLRIVEDARIAEVAIAGEDIGEANESAEEDEIVGFQPGEADKAVVTGDDGSIMIPAAACYSPRESTSKVLLMKSWDEGAQIHYGRLGGRPELIKYRIELPAAGEYELSAKVATVSLDMEMIARINRDEPLSIAMPYTGGMWEMTEPIRVKLEAGRNTISFTARAPHRGVSIKSWHLKPVK